MAHFLLVTKSSPHSGGLRKTNAVVTVNDGSNDDDDNNDNNDDEAIF